MAERELFTNSSRGGLPTNEPLSVTSICPDEDSWRLLKLFADSSGLIRLGLRLSEYLSDEHDAVGGDGLGNPAPDICLIDFDKDRRKAAAVAERLHTSVPEMVIFAVSAQSRPETIIEAMRSGCSEYLVKPINREQLVDAVARVSSRKKEKKEYCKGQVLAFIGAKGGCGVTTIATHLAALLASEYSRKTLLIDLHREFGDAALYLGLTKPRYHFFELLESSDRLDAELLTSFLMQHSSGLDVIPAPEGTDMARDFPPDALSHVLEFLRQQYEFILVDLPAGLGEQNLPMIRYADNLYLVTVAEVSAVRNVVRQLESAQREIAPEKIRVVLNRHQKRSAVNDDQIEKVMGQKLFWRVPNQYAQVVKTIYGGDPISQIPNSEVGRNIRDWAGAVGKKLGPETGKRKEGLGILSLWNR